MAVLMLALASVALAAPGAPTVLSTVPEDFAEGVDYNANVRIKFSEAMRANSINPATVYLLDFNCHQCSEERPLLPSTVKYNADNRTAVLNPSDPLPDGQWAVIVEGNSDEDILTVKDRSGAAMAEEYFFTFQTGTGWDGTNPPPCTVGCEPADEEGADWQMDDTSGQMFDSSGNNNTGTPTNVGQTGSSFVFNGTNSYVTVPDSDSLDPEESDITLSAGVTVTDTPMNDDSYDVVRKGLSATPGGDYKMEIMRRTSNPSVGKLHCLFKGTGGKVDIVAQRDIVDGNFHTLECIKTSTSVVARIDGEIGGTTAGSAGSISNASNVMVGAKTANPLDDVFNGSMDFVSIDIAQ
jgi:hypothetical protein